MLTIDRLYDAKNRLAGVIRKTDIIRASGLGTECDLYLKTENLQITGSFKVRGAYYKISSLTAEERKKGVVASSAEKIIRGRKLRPRRAARKAVAASKARLYSA